MPTFISSLAFKLIVAAAIVIVLLVAVSQCTGQRKVAEQAKQDGRVSEATAIVAKNTAAVVINRSAEDMNVDQLVQETIEEMDNVDDPKASAIAARAAICELMPDSCVHPTH